MAVRLSHYFVLVTLLACYAWRSNATSTPASNAGDILTVLEHELQNCSTVQKLGTLKIAVEGEESPIMRQVFAWLFPFGPAANSILGTFYISSIPNFILAFIPAEISGNTLNTMTAFATGGLLSDVFLHLVPHSFMGEHQDPGVYFVMVEEKRNILIGLGIFIGFATFFFMEKTLRVLGGEGDGESSGFSHSHSHSHAHDTNRTATKAETSAVKVSTSENGLRARKGDQATKEDEASPESAAKSSSGPSKLSAYLNLFGDFVHNIMAASFYASPLIGATTTLACFAHEIPHEIADYSILVRSGFTKRQAMQSQFLTAIGAFVGTFIGIAVHNATSDGETPAPIDLAAGVRQDAAGLLGTTVMLSDLVIPFVAGGFLYIGAVAVLPTYVTLLIVLSYGRLFVLSSHCDFGYIALPRRFTGHAESLITAPLSRVPANASA
ncbi:Zinc transporter SLC39A7 [Leucoagaricus sp. SymC.cos]|nr:Zinc transporter SLC39A7 [Leucoagaricus sp. SymC.cos]